MSEYRKTFGQKWCKEHNRLEDCYVRTYYRPDEKGIARKIIEYVPECEVPDYEK